ncbi:MAG: MlaD family protein [Actinomycetota bacterium]|nr:MlaD family protein [Actinomycetota bacterium]
MGSSGEDQNEGRGRAPLAIALGLVAAAVVYLVLFSAGDEYQVTGEFLNASQLVDGNEVVIGGVPVGKVKQINLGADGMALVDFSIDSEYAPLKRGTVAQIRWTSLSSVAQRRIELTVPAANADAPAIEDGGMLTKEETIAEVDIDQIFNTLNERTVRDFKRVIQGFARSYEGVERDANQGFRYLNPLLYQSRRVFGELSRDERTLENFLVDTSRFSGALADRAPDVSALVGNLNRMMTAIGDRKEFLARGIALLPDFMRNANTTFVNLRVTLDDVDPLITASKPAVEELSPFLDELRVLARNSVPTVRDLRALIKRSGPDNDLIELQRLQPKLRKIAIGSGSPNCGPGGEDPEDFEVVADNKFSQGAFGEATCSLTNSLTSLAFFRAYTPELVGWFDGFSHSGNSDALGGMGRVGTTFNTFTPSFPFVPSPATLMSPEQQLAALSTGYVNRCPGSAERPFPGDDSVPFTDQGEYDLTDGKGGSCDPNQVIPGP